jgi:hypothetical protein
MDRFNEETAADLGRNYNRRFYAERFEDETHMRDENDYDAENCPDEEPVCEFHQQLVREHFRLPVAEFLEAMKVHDVQCAECCSERKTVVSDRLHVDPAAVCCGEAA